jgi:Tol biopolymer transport system component
VIDQQSVERAAERFRLPDGSFERLALRRDRKRRSQRIRAGALGLAIAIAVGWLGINAIRSTSPVPGDDRSEELGIFEPVAGRIVYESDGGIYAVDPSRPNDPQDRILVSEQGGVPLGWSSDGSRLLIRREVPDPKRDDPVSDTDLFVLNADGTETRVTHYRRWITGSISPDGSQVVFAPGYGDDVDIYTVDTGGGEPRLLLDSENQAYNPTFSPDGTQIAYFDGGGDHSHSLRVMNADGSGVRVLIDEAPVGHVRNLVWSPDGSHLAFSSDDGVWVVGIDGSGLTEVIPDGTSAYWSPDGSRISYESVDPLSGALGGLEIAAVDGTQVQEFGYGGSGPWNPAVPTDDGDDRSEELGIFEPVAGRIVSRSLGGIFAVDPTRPNDPNPILWSERDGVPLGWSSDGSRLLIRVRNADLFVLNADGTETRLTNERDWITGSISPDGSQVVYASSNGGMYTVDTGGGEPRLLIDSSDLIYYNPTFSPDGTQIAFINGGGDHTHNVWVMNADGSNAHEIVSNEWTAPIGHVNGLAWSPTGDRIALALIDGPNPAIYMFAPDGSDFKLVIPGGTSPYWSPDGSQIAYEVHGRVGLFIADADGTNVQEFGFGDSGPWNPARRPG